MVFRLLKMTSGFINIDLHSSYGFSLFEIGLPVVYRMNGGIFSLLAGSDRNEIDVRYQCICSKISEHFEYTIDFRIE